MVPQMKKKDTLNMISGGFVSEGETNGAREVYIASISTKVPLGKRLRPDESVAISLSNEKHVTSAHDDALVITVEIDVLMLKGFWLM